MPLIEWSDNLSVKSRLLDTDHKRLIDLINKLYEASASSGQNGSIDEAITMLISFTKTHFVHEETLMRKTAYPQLIPHKISHDRLMTQVEDFRKRLNAGQVGVSADTMIFLRTWLCDHVARVDIHLGKWLAKVEPAQAAAGATKNI